MCVKKRLKHPYILEQREYYLVICLKYTLLLIWFPIWSRPGIPALEEEMFDCLVLVTEDTILIPFSKIVFGKNYPMTNIPP
jgi:hypothetical protein